MRREIMAVVSGTFWGSILGCVLAGCGAAENSPAPHQTGQFIGFDHGVPLFEPTSEEADAGIGQAAKALIVPKTGSEFAPGVRADGTLRACDLVNNSQNCVVTPGEPDGHKGVRMGFTGNTASIQAVKDQVSLWKTNRFVGGGLWTVPEHGFDGTDISFATSANDPNINLIINASTSSTGACSGSAGNLTANVCFTGQTTGVTKHAPLKGTYHTWAAGTVPILHVDWRQLKDRLDAGEITNGQYLNLLRQAVRAGLDMFTFNVGIEENSGFCTTDTELKNNPCLDIWPLECIGNAMGDNGNTSDVWQLNPDCGF